MVSVLLKGRVQDNTAHLWEAPKAGQEAPQPSCRGGVPVSTQSPGTCGEHAAARPSGEASLPAHPRHLPAVPELEMVEKYQHNVLSDNTQREKGSFLLTDNTDVSNRTPQFEQAHPIGTRTAQSPPQPPGKGLRNGISFGTRAAEAVSVPIGHQPTHSRVHVTWTESWSFQFRKCEEAESLAPRGAQRKAS